MKGYGAEVNCSPFIGVLRPADNEGTPRRRWFTSASAHSERLLGARGDISVILEPSPPGSAPGRGCSSPATSRVAWTAQVLRSDSSFVAAGDKQHRRRGSRR